MGVIEEKKITFPETEYPIASSFVIERFQVPSQLKDIHIKLQAPSDSIKLVLIYDSHYNLRAESDAIQNKKEIHISENELKTSIGAKHGPIHSGEWIIAFEFNREEGQANEAACYLTVSTKVD